MDENHRLAPQSPYAASKIGSDMLAWSYYRTYGLPVTILRPFNTFGPRQSPRAVIPAIIIQALRSTSIRLGSLAPRRDLTFVTDTARGFVAAAVSPGAVGQVVQLGSQRETTIAEIVELVGRILKKRLRVRRELRRIRPATSEVERLFASNRKAAELLGWRPEIPLVEGLEKTIRWFESRSAFYKHDLYHI
jgi:dTDP-glucose 4,6-dehydratase